MEKIDVFFWGSACQSALKVIAIAILVRSANVEDIAAF